MKETGPWTPDSHSRWLPDGRFELTLGKCVPVIVRPGTFFGKTASELYCLTGLLTLIADYFRQLPDVDLPPLKSCSLHGDRRGVRPGGERE